MNMLTLQNVILGRSGVVKLSISSQIFNATENIWILPNFILRRSGVVKIYFLSQIFNTNQNFSRFCQISSFAGSEWSTLSFFSQICSETENFWILPNFILCMSRVIKLLILGLILIAIENFWILPHFILCMSLVVKNVCF